MCKTIDEIISALDTGGNSSWRNSLNELLRQKETFQRCNDAKSQAYLQILAQLPQFPSAKTVFAADRVSIGTAADLDEHSYQQLQHALFALRPWRKGPFNLYGIGVDCEWVSYLKWQRIYRHLSPLRGRKILDVGSSCGYYMFRMSVDRPQLLLGLEPYATFYFQFRLLQQLFKLNRCYTLPVKFEEMPMMAGYFDTIFHMGVLYHVRSPLDTLIRLRRTLRRGGELILETLIIPGDENLSLSPDDRYAKMNNVYFLPTVNCLTSWLEKSGFTAIRCVDITRTTSKEQRKTAWIQTESLADFLDPEDELLTVEGYPAPRRAVMIAQVK